MRWLLFLLMVLMIGISQNTFSQEKKGGGASGGAVKSKFYDFSDQVIDGEIKKPTALYTDARQQAKFDRLLKLNKSFIQPMLQSAKEQVFK